MVLTCNSCSESFGKKAVKKHDQECLASKGVTCNECKNVFEDYKTHLNCANLKKTDSEKTEDSDVSGGRQKQVTWINTLKELTQESDIDPEVKKILDNITQKHENFPRNPKKYKNYLTFSMKTSPEVIEKLDNYITSKVERLNAGPQNKNKGQKDSEMKKNKKGQNKRKLEEENSNEQMKKKKNNESTKETKGDPLNGVVGTNTQTKKSKKRKPSRKPVATSDNESGDAGQEGKMKRKLETEDSNVQKKKKNNKETEKLTQNASNPDQTKEKSKRRMPRRGKGKTVES